MLVQLEAKGMGVFAFPGESRGRGGSGASGSPRACKGSQLRESAGPLWGHCPQTLVAGRMAACIPQQPPSFPGLLQRAIPA